jgi:hypothetical protein
MTPPVVADMACRAEGAGENGRWRALAASERTLVVRERALGAGNARIGRQRGDP